MCCGNCKCGANKGCGKIEPTIDMKKFVQKIKESATEGFEDGTAFIDPQETVFNVTPREEE